MKHPPAALAIEDIVIPQGATEGATWPTPWLYAEGDPLAPPAGWPGSWTARMQVRHSYGSAPVATLDSADLAADGGLLLDTYVQDTVTYALVTPQVDPSVSDAWTWRLGVYDVELHRIDGSRVIRIVEGRAELSAEVTRG